MPEPDAPAATIVIPAWRVTDELTACLDAVAGLTDPPAFEVVVVLNGAPAEVRAIAEEHPVVDRTIGLPANVGFGAACNLAAREASGRYLVFLNDDTSVDPAWLSALVAAADADPGRAMVASLLLDVDGRVQEAGSRLRADAGTVQFGRGLTVDAARDAGLLDARRVDYGSGAALLVRADWFDRLGGFDPLYEPAYFEDVDLALRVAEAGGTVWFEPAARVTHHSGGSTSGDPWFRAWAADRSGRLFLERWTEVLANAVGEDAPVTSTIAVPRAERPPARPAHSERDLGAEYAAWLAERLQRATERNDQLARRVIDLEGRGPLGMLKARIGLWLNARRG